MRRQLSLLLVGAMMASPILAQKATVQPKYPLDVAITYSAAMSNATTTDRFWMQGGSAQLHGQLYRGLGVVAEVSGTHTGSINSSGVGLDIVTATFGPRYTWSPARSRYSIFGQALVGEANGFASVFPTVRGASDSSNSLAVQAGGGLNLSLSPRMALRICEASWMRTQFPNGTTNAQDFLRLGAGVVLRFR
jgi:hypothetical protein